LTYGRLEKSPIQIKEIVSFYRIKGDDKAFVLHNISNTDITVPIDLDGFYRLDFGTKEGIELRETEIVMPAHSTAVLID
jgi:hypothetical protein